MNLMRFDTDSPRLEGATITLGRCCAKLGIDPPLLPGQQIVWRGWDASNTIGINGQINCFGPEDDQPFLLSLGVYEMSRVPAPPGRDYGVDNRLIASLEFELGLAEGATLDDDPRRLPLRLVEVDLDPAWAGYSFMQVLDELRRMLAGWPVIREEMGI